MNFTKTLLIIVTFLFLSISFLGETFAAEKVNRLLLGVLDGEEIENDYDNKIHRMAEMPLEHLGFKIEYVDVSKKIPSEKEMEKYFGIISWFSDDLLESAANYSKWITGQLKKGKKLVVLDHFGFFYERDGNRIDENLINNFFDEFHAKFNPGEYTKSPLLIELAKNDPKMTEFERKFDGDFDIFYQIEARGQNPEVYLQLKRKDSKAIFDAVFINDRGGLAFGNYVVYTNPLDFQTRWRINPFLYFAKAFNSDFPKPDVTTLNGMRLFFSHIDGDGIRNISQTNRKQTSGEILFEEVFKKYKVPITTSVLVADILMTEGKQKESLIKLIKEIFKLPNIEPASHGWLHPLIWEESKRKMAVKIKGHEYSPQKEIGDSIEYINKYLVPENKKTNLFLWTGNCEPDYEALKYIYDHKLMNMNGGDSRFDDEFPSYTFVSPLFRHVDGLLQYFTADANEVIYTNIWQGPFYGFKDVVQTYENTESPIRIKPIDVYYHFYIAERDEALKTVYTAYNWVLEHEVTPVFATDYLKIVKGFLSTEIEKLSDNNWIIKNNGELKTIRFDNNSSSVDLSKSKNVLGFHPFQGSLYVHLGNKGTSNIVLTKTKPANPYLSKANGRIGNWDTSSNSVDFTLNTMGRLHFEIGGLQGSKKYSIALKRDGVLDKNIIKFIPWIKESKTISATTDKNGFLEIKNIELGFNFEDIKVEIKPNS